MRPCVKAKAENRRLVSQAGLIFRDAIAAGRREIRGHRISFMSRPR
jgi:hypothetical protein